MTIPQHMSVTERPSLVDVFENFLGADITALSRASVHALSDPQLDELVEVIDGFLMRAQHDAYPADAVMLDVLTNPIVTSSDPSVPKTTRAVKQVALAHREVVIPIGNIGIDYRSASSRIQGANYPGSLLEWCRSCHVLLRNHVISVADSLLLSQVFGDGKDSLIRELVDILIRPEHESSLRHVVRPSDSVEERREALQAALTCVLMDVVNANNIDGNLAHVDPGGGELYHQIVNLTKGPAASPADDVRGARLLRVLNLPAIDDVPDSDFVAIRMQSDDFEEYRNAVGRVLSKTEVAANAGKPLEDAFKDSLDEIHVRADQLRREVKDRAVKRYLVPSLVGVQLGAVVSTTAALASDAVRAQIDPGSLLARLLTTAGLGSLVALMTHKPPSGRQRMLRFYEVLCRPAFQAQSD